MLISHRKRFIFTKTSKTAGTTVEAYFEPYCLPEGQWSFSHRRGEYVSETGIVGYRGPLSGRKLPVWYNHMSARKIRDRIGANTWDAYFKFTVVRNPFDKLISTFFMYENRKKKYTILQKLKALVKKAVDRGNPIDRVSGRTDVARFRSWIRKGGSNIDRNKYLIDGKECVDFFIRFENMSDDIKTVCDRLSLPFESSRINWLKKGKRPKDIHIRDYYDSRTEEIVRGLYSWEFQRFGYEFPE